MEDVCIQRIVKNTVNQPTKATVIFEREEVPTYEPMFEDVTMS